MVRPCAALCAAASSPSSRRCAVTRSSPSVPLLPRARPWVNRRLQSQRPRHGPTFGATRAPNARPAQISCPVAESNTYAGRPPATDAGTRPTRHVARGSVTVRSTLARPACPHQTSPSGVTRCGQHWCGAAPGFPAQALSLTLRASFRVPGPGSAGWPAPRTCREASSAARPARGRSRWGPGRRPGSRGRPRDGRPARRGPRPGSPSGSGR